jgi:hypothetical protein
MAQLEGQIELTREAASTQMNASSTTSVISAGN